VDEDHSAPPPGCEWQRPDNLDIPKSQEEERRRGEEAAVAVAAAVQAGVGARVGAPVGLGKAMQQQQRRRGMRAAAALQAELVRVQARSTSARMPGISVGA